jgi:hypothetical protein
MSVAQSRAGDELRFGLLAVPRHCFGFVCCYYNHMAPRIGSGNPTITVFAQAL